VATEEFVKELWHITGDGSYSPTQIFSINETAVFWKIMPCMTNMSEEEKYVPRFKTAKKNFTLLFR
jgi:hypothetical protein